LADAHISGRADKHERFSKAEPPVLHCEANHFFAGCAYRLLQIFMRGDERD